MPTFIALLNETQHGEENIKESVDRARRFRELAGEFGVTVTAQYWTLGGFDGVLVLDAPDAKVASALIHRLTSGGAVRSQTLQAFDAEEMTEILERSGV